MEINKKLQYASIYLSLLFLEDLKEISDASDN